jgi:hypothetical protein
MTWASKKISFRSRPRVPTGGRSRKDIFLVSPSFFIDMRLTFKTVAAFAGMTYVVMAWFHLT